MNSSSSLPFGQWLKQRRKMLGLTQSALAGKVACAVVTIKKIEQGDLHPSRQLAGLLASQLDVPQNVRESFIQFARSPHRFPSHPFHLPPHFNSANYEPEDTQIPIPAPLTDLIGRERELAALTERLCRSDVRLLTLTGPPGAGKTRLGLQTSVSVRPHFRHGVHFIELAPLNEPRQVLETIAQVFHVRETANRTLKKALFARLQDRQTLLILDNFEQVLPAASLVSEILTHAKGVNILVTSREPLGIYGEHQFSVSPLELPKAGDPVPALKDNPAIVLFLQRAQAAWPEFELTEANAQGVACICIHLDGLPLAIEMAAAQVKWLPPDKLLSQLQARLASLRNNARNLPERQQSLRGAIEWSYDYLNPHEKQMLARLAVFVGGCSVEAATAILGWEDEDRFLPSEVESLISKSLVQYTIPFQTPGGLPRIWMLETIRAFSLEKLRISKQEHEVRRTHAMYYTQFAEKTRSQLHGTSHQDLLMELEAEYHNFRTALRWCVQNDPEMGLRLSIALNPLWTNLGYLNEGRAWIGELLLLSDHVPASLRAQALLAAGYMANLQDDLLRARTLLTEALHLYRKLNNQVSVADTLVTLASVCLFENQYKQLETYANEALALSHELKHLPGIVGANNALGAAAKEQGRHQQAITYFEENLRISRENGNQRGISSALLELSNNYYWMGDYARTIELAQQSLEINRGLTNKLNLASSLETVGMALFKLGDPARARPLLEESLTIYKEMESLSGEVLVLSGLGHVDQTLGDVEQATKDFQEALRIAHEMGDKRRMAFSLEGLAKIWSEIEPHRAAQLLGAANNLRILINSPLPPGEQTGHQLIVHHTQSVLGDTAFSTAWDGGSQFTFMQILETAGIKNDRILVNPITNYTLKGGFSHANQQRT